MRACILDTILITILITIIGVGAGIRANASCCGGGGLTRVQVGGIERDPLGESAQSWIYITLHTKQVVLVSVSLEVVKQSRLCCQAKQVVLV